MNLQQDKKKIIIIIIAITVSTLAIKYLNKGKPVEAYKVIKQNSTTGVTVTGTVQSDGGIFLAPSVTSRITKLYTKEGKFVKRGQILAKLSTTEAEGNLESSRGQYETAIAQLQNLETEPRIQEDFIAQAKVDEIKQNLDSTLQELEKSKIQLKDTLSTETRYNKLYKQGAISLQDYQKATYAREQAERNISGLQDKLNSNKAQVKQAEENLSLVKAGTKSEQINAAIGQIQVAKGQIKASKGKLDYYILKSPVDGYVAQKFLNSGETASPTSPILRIIDPSTIYINTQVEENQFKDVRNNQNAYIIFDAYPTTIFSGKVKHIINSIDPITGTFKVDVRVLPKENKPIYTGMSTDVSIITKSIKNTLVIPNEFIQIKNQKKYVMLVSNSKTLKKNIETETFDNNKSIVTKGLKSNDIIAKGINSAKLTENKKVEIKSYYKD